MPSVKRKKGQWRCKHAVRFNHGGACVHCGNPAMNPRRGLCQPCYRKPGVKQQYAPVCVQPQLPSANRNSVLPTEWTDAPPGTEAKIQVMIRRAAQGVGLFHPKDKSSLDGVNWRELALGAYYVPGAVEDSNDEVDDE